MAAKANPPWKGVGGTRALAHLFIFIYLNIYIIV